MAKTLFNKIKMARKKQKENLVGFTEDGNQLKRTMPWKLYDTPLNFSYEKYDWIDFLPLIVV